MLLPYILILFRFLLAPTILWIAYATPETVARPAIVIAIVLGLLSDIFDGIIARHRGISTVKMRRLDSQTDLVFWLSVGVACYWLNPALITAYRYQIITLFVMEALCYGLSFLRFGRETCTHAFLSKIWRLPIAVSYLLGTIIPNRCHSYYTVAPPLAKRHPQRLPRLPYQKRKDHQKT